MYNRMAKIVCKASLLKTDDYRLKDLTHSHRASLRCDMFKIENIITLICSAPLWRRKDPTGLIDCRAWMLGLGHSWGMNLRMC